MTEQIEDFRILSQAHPTSVLEVIPDTGTQIPPCRAPDVLILTRGADRESGFLADSLRRCGVAVRRVDIDRPPRLEVRTHNGRARLRIDDDVVDPRVVLQRYFSPNAVGPEDPDQREFARKEWRPFAQIILGMYADRLLNPTAALGFIDCLTQQAAATAAGFHVPRTRIGNYLTVTSGPALLKAVSSHEIETRAGHMRVVRPVEVEGTPVDPRLLQRAPVVQQAKMSSSLPEIRVYVIGQDVVAYRVSQTGDRDRWMKAADVEVTPFDLSQNQRDRFIEFAALCRLDLCAIDAFVSGDDLVFLEVNPVFNWMWYEARARTHDVSLLIVKAIMSRLDGAARPGTDGDRR